MTPTEKTAAALAALGGGYLLLRYEELRTGDSRLDRIGVRGRSLYWGLRLRVPPELLMAIAKREGQAWLNPQISDTGIERGPSVGPLAVLRTTAISEGYVAPETDAATYAAFGSPSQEATTFEWGARYLAKLYAKHTGNVADTLSEYNGSSSYGGSALTWLSATYPRQFAA